MLRAISRAIVVIEEEFPTELRHGEVAVKFDNPVGADYRKSMVWMQKFLQVLNRNVSSILLILHSAMDSQKEKT